MNQVGSDLTSYGLVRWKNIVLTIISLLQMLKWVGKILYLTNQLYKIYIYKNGNIYGVLKWALLTMNLFLSQSQGRRRGKVKYCMEEPYWNLNLSHDEYIAGGLIMTYTK